SGEVGLEPKAQPSPTSPGVHARANPGDSAEATVMRSALQPPAPFAAQHRSPHPASTVAEPTVRRSSVPQPSPAAPTGQPGAPYAGAEQTVMRSSLPPTMPGPPTPSDSRREPQGYRPLPEPSFNGQETVARSGLSIPQYPIPPSRTQGVDANGGAVPMWASRTPPRPLGANQPQPHTDLAIDPMSLRRRVRIRSGASALVIDEQHLVLRSWWRKTEIAWSDVLGFELRFETTNVSGSGGHLVAVTHNGSVELPSAKRPMADLRYVQALLEAYRRRSHMMPG
ncbi:MAG: hypothetical protein M3Y06_04650, partial [Actinomycetota bacterium]|nr:hypothetical protein [Actinomycetota bacterium]